MKPALALLLFLCLTAQLAARYGVVRYFERNQAFIAQNLCENRNRPELKCCGKCYLQKQLKKVDGAAGESPAKNQSAKAEKGATAACTLPCGLQLCLQRAAPLCARRTPARQRMHDGGTAASVFHPPPAAA